MYYVVRTEDIQVGHCLPASATIASEACKRLHGHSYLVTVVVASKELDSNGMVCDLGHIASVIKKFDHNCLNDLMKAATTMENFAILLAEEVDTKLVSIESSAYVAAVLIKETNKNYTLFMPEEIMASSYSAVVSQLATMKS